MPDAEERDVNSQRSLDRKADTRLRQCAVTRECRDEADLIRFVKGPENDLVPDLKRKLPGRGVWISADRDTIARAVKQNVFARGLKGPVKISQDVPDQIERLLRSAALGRLGLARKAGQAVCGSSKVNGAIAGRNALCVLSASDGAADGKRKISDAMRRAGWTIGDQPMIEMFRSDELGLAFGRTNVIHAAVLRGSAGESFADAAARLLRYEGSASGTTAHSGQTIGPMDRNVSVRGSRPDSRRMRAGKPQGSTE